MPYTVFARKYRPRTFDEVVGQEHVVRALRNAVEQDRVGHAYLFSGPRGTGKTTMARLLAKSINCVRGTSVTPCGTCELCTAIQAGTDTDVVEYDAASRRGVNDADALREGIQYAPLRARVKIVILDEVHMLSDHAFNALLKTLEEPPPHVRFIFATTEPQKVPDTIRSRCQHLEFRRMSSAQIVERLTHIATQEKLQVPPPALRAVALQAQGSLRDAESMLDQLVAFSPDGVQEEDVRTLLGSAPEAWVFRLVDRIGESALADVLPMVQEIYLQGADPATLLDQCIEHHRRLLLLKATGRADAAEELLPDLRRQAERQTPQGLLYALQILLEARRRLSGDADPQLVLELAFAKLAISADLPSLTELIDRSEGGGPAPAPPVPPTLKGGPPPPPAAPPVKGGTTAPSGWAAPRSSRQPPPPAPPPPPQDYRPTDLQTFVERWPSIAESLKADHPAAAALLAQAHPLAVDGGRAWLLVRAEAAPEGSPAREAVDRALAAALGHPVGAEYHRAGSPVEAPPKGHAVHPLIGSIFSGARVVE